MREHAPQQLSKSALQAKFEYLAGKGYEKSAELKKIEDELNKAKQPYENRKISIQKQLKAQRHMRKGEAERESEKDEEVMRLREAYERVLHANDKRIRELKKDIEMIKGESMTIFGQIDTAPDEGEEWSAEEEERKKVSTPPNVRMTEIIKDKDPRVIGLTKEQLKELEGEKTFIDTMNKMWEMYEESGRENQELGDAIEAIRRMDKEGAKRSSHAVKIRDMLKDDNRIPEEIKKIIGKFTPREVLRLKETPDSFKAVAEMRDRLLESTSLSDIKKVLKAVSKELSSVAHEETLSSKLRKQFDTAWKLESQLKSIIYAVDKHESDERKIKELEKIQDEKVKELISSIVFPKSAEAEVVGATPMPEKVEDIDKEIEKLETLKKKAPLNKLPKIIEQIDVLRKRKVEILLQGTDQVNVPVTYKPLEELTFGPVPENWNQIKIELATTLMDLQVETKKELAFLQEEKDMLDKKVIALKKTDLHKRAEKLSDILQKVEENKQRMALIKDREEKIEERVLELNKKREALEKEFEAKKQAQQQAQSATSQAQPNTTPAAHQNVAPQPKQESEQERLERHGREIASAQNFDELYATLRNIGVITHYGNIKKLPRNPENIIKYIEEARAKKSLDEIFIESNVNHVPDHAGLNAKVKELFEKENASATTIPPVTSPQPPSQNIAPSIPNFPPELLFANLNLGPVPDTLTAIEAELQGPLRDLYHKLTDELYEAENGNPKNLPRKIMSRLRHEIGLVNDRVAQLQAKKQSSSTGAAAGTVPVASQNTAPQQPAAATNAAPVTPGTTPAKPKRPSKKAKNQAQTNTAPNTTGATPNAAPQTQNNGELKTVDNFYAERAILLAEREKYQQGDPMHDQLTRRIDAINTNIDTLKGEWALEEKNAEATLGVARREYLQGKDDYEKNRGGRIKRGFGWIREKLNPFNALKRRDHLVQTLSTLSPNDPEYITLNAKVKELESKAWVKAELKLRETTDKYEMMRKSYANAISQGEWEIHRKLNGDIPYDTPEYEILNAKIKARQIQKVLIPEQRKLEELERVRAFPPRERGICRRMIEAYAGMSKPKRIMIGALIAAAPAAAVSSLVFLGTAARHAARIAIGTTLGAAAAEKFAAKRSVKLDMDHKNAIDDLTQTFNAFEKGNKVTEVQEDFKKKYRNLGLSKALVAAAAGGGFAALAGAFDNLFFRQGLPIANANTGNTQNSIGSTPSNTLAVPDSNVELEKPSVSEIKVDDTPAEKVFGEEHAGMLSERAATPQADEVFDEEYAQVTANENPAPASYVQASAIDQVSPVVPETHVRTFIDDIEDKMRGSRVLRSDSAELSAKRIFENNAKELGYDRSSGMSVKKWATMKVEELVKEHPEVRNAITHNGNSIKINFNTDGSVASVVLEKGDGMMPTLKGKPIGVVAAPVTETPKVDIQPAAEPVQENPPAPEEPKIERSQSVTKASPESPDLPEPESLPISSNIHADLFNTKSFADIPHSLQEVSAQGMPDAATVAKAVSAELPNRIEHIFPKKTWGIGPFKWTVSPITDIRWIAASNINAETLLRTDIDQIKDVPGFLRSKLGISEALINREQLKELKDIVKTAKENNVLVPGMRVGAALREMVRVQEVAKLLKTAVRN